LVLSGQHTSLYRLKDLTRLLIIPFKLRSRAYNANGMEQCGDGIIKAVSLLLLVKVGNVLLSVHILLEVVHLSLFSACVSMI
jgi:hypothetical protein